MPLAMSLDNFGLANLRSVERESEALGEGLVRVGIRAVSLNYRDVLIMRGTYGEPVSLPLIPCSDGAGVVLEVGAGVMDLGPGARVCAHMVPDWQQGQLEPRMRRTTLGGPAQGVLCEQRVLPRTALVQIPDTLTFERAACLPVAGLAAWSALTAGVEIGRASRVLLVGTGGVSMLGLRIAKTLGAKVAVVSSSDDKLARVGALGADFVANYRRAGWGQLVYRWSEGGVDIVLETGGSETFDESMAATRDGGCIAVLGVRGRVVHPVTLADVVTRRIRLQGIFVGSRVDLQHLVRFVEAHALDPIIDRVFTRLSAARAAFAYLLSGQHLGKIVVLVSG
jgi:NADPH:quinone reductase-like Zn-dependent oxidoreductase